ncbi:MAG: type VI secretion system baseplate subunit TssK [Pirellulaceae bacterium]|nr:type VI secretion system baseplate subunit TssK [Pirellulaceae bacterium]
MRNPPVNWYEGLFLRPHHFQASERNWAETLQTSEQWDHPYNYGLVALDFSREALGNHQFEVRELKARLRDGTLVSLAFGQEPDRLNLRDEVQTLGKALADLSDAFNKEPTIRVYVGIPKLKLGRPNVAQADGAGPTRFAPARLPIPDEVSGGNEQEVELRALNIKLLLSTQDLSGYELLPIAQVKRASAGSPRPQLDDSYIPPVITIDAWQGLSRDIVRAVYDMIGQKIEVLSDQIASRNIGLESRNAGDTDRILMLSELNAAHNVLSILGFAQGVHPLVAYTELCRIAGQLSIFAPTRRTEAVPPYDHDNLHGIFKEIQLRIERLLNAVRDYEYEQRYFVGVGLGMQVTLESKWFNSDWQWYIGVNKGDLTPQECRDLLSSGQLDWKLGSSRQVEILFKQRAPGLELRPLDRHPRALPSQTDWLYYEVNRNDTPSWRDVQATQTLAMRLKDSLIVNLDRLQGERQLVISNRGRNIPLQFALYAVPTRV